MPKPTKPTKQQKESSDIKAAHSSSSRTKDD